MNPEELKIELWKRIRNYDNIADLMEIMRIIKKNDLRNKEYNKLL